MYFLSLYYVSFDVHFWKSGRIGSLVFAGDCILGHEASGVVLKVGDGANDLKPGKTSGYHSHYFVLTGFGIPNDRVVAEPGVPCGLCFMCTDGRYNLCADVKFSGVYPHHGTMQRYKIHPTRWVHRYAHINLCGLKLIKC
jgi:L-iditol 2-dehydrogenase